MACGRSEDHHWLSERFHVSLFSVSNSLWTIISDDRVRSVRAGNHCSVCGTPREPVRSKQLGRDWCGALMHDNHLSIIYCEVTHATMKYNKKSVGSQQLYARLIAWLAVRALIETVLNLQSISKQWTRCYIHRLSLIWRSWRKIVRTNFTNRYSITYSLIVLLTLLEKLKLSLNLDVVDQRPTLWRFGF